MLVLSRNQNQAIRFPGLGVSVEILEVRGSKVKLGVDAPMEVRVLRDELADDQVESSFKMRLPQSMRHELRNALHELSLQLHVYLKRIEREDPHTEAGPIDAEEMFQAIVSRLEHVGGGREPIQLPADALAVTNPRKRLGDALVVDDDANERELLAGFLRMCDYDVNVVRDGIEAGSFIRQNQAPKFILLDMFMPRCDGRQFLADLRTNRKFDDTHVFVVSGSSPEELNMSVRKGYTHWFRKPLDPRRIVEAINKIENPSPLATAN